MKIIMVHPHDLFSSMEPWTIRIIKFAEELLKKGHEVKIAYFPLRKATISSVHGIDVVPLERTISLGSIMGNIKAFVELSRWADLVHFQKSHFYAALPALLAAYWVGKPIHYDWDDWEEQIFYASIPKTTLTSVLTGISFYIVEWCLPFLVDSISVSSETLKSLAIKRGASESRIVLAPVGADLNLFQARRNANFIRDRYNIGSDVLVMYHGQLHSCQYANIFLQAIKFISEIQTGVRIKFMIVGDGAQLAMLKKVAQELGIGSEVIFTGFVEHADIPVLIAAADICVAPFEDNKVTRCKSPLKIAEYLAVGKAIVASDVGAVRDMVGHAGLLVPPGSPLELAKGIIELAGNKARRDVMAVAARQRAESMYNWSYSVDKLEKVYWMDIVLT